MIIDIIQLISAVLLIIVVLIQNQSSGLGSAFGGQGGVNRSKRGAEKGLFILTIILSITFLATALVNVIWF